MSLQTVPFFGLVCVSLNFPLVFFFLMVHLPVKLNRFSEWKGWRRDLFDSQEIVLCKDCYILLYLLKLITQGNSQSLILYLSATDLLMQQGSRNRQPYATE